MTGTGTSADPYICENWNEVLTATSEAGKYVEISPLLELTHDTEIVPNKLYFTSQGEIINSPQTDELATYYENAKVFDFNDISPDGTKWTIKSQQIDGKGITIRNFRNSLGNGIEFFSTYVKVFKNCMFENIINSGDSPFIIGSSTSRTIINCKFEGENSSSDNMFSLSNAEFYRCGFNIKYNNGGAFMTISYAPTFQDCIIISKGKSANTYFATNSNDTTRGIVLQNSLVSGVCPTTQFDIGWYSSSYYPYNSIINMEFDSNSVISWGTTNASKALSNVLINSSKLNGSTVSCTELTQVTDSQLKNADYLDSIGFPIVI